MKAGKLIFESILLDRPRWIAYVHGTCTAIRNDVCVMFNIKEK
jgi:hypothetical protein